MIQSTLSSGNLCKTSRQSPLMSCEIFGFIGFCSDTKIKFSVRQTPRIGLYYTTWKLWLQKTKSAGIWTFVSLVVCSPRMTNGNKRAKRYPRVCIQQPLKGVQKAKSQRHTHGDVYSTPVASSFALFLISIIWNFRGFKQPKTSIRLTLYVCSRTGFVSSCVTSAVHLSFAIFWHLFITEHNNMQN